MADTPTLPRAQALLAPAVVRLREAGIASPAADARTLLGWAAGVEPSRLLIEGIDEAAARRFERAITARAAGTPVQHLTGEAHFRAVRLRVGPGVFLPRPETEALAGWAIERLRELGPTGGADGGAPLAVDLGAGSGTIAVAIAAECPGCRIAAVERDPTAVGYLRDNVDRVGACAEWRVVNADMAGALPDLDGQVDVVVSNPPYIPERDRGLVSPEVLAHDPPAALFAGTDGLDGLRLVAEVASRLLRPGGWLAVEHDETTGRASVDHLMGTGRFGEVEDHRDLTGRPRFVTARKLAG